VRSRPDVPVRLHAHRRPGLPALDRHFGAAQLLRPGYVFVMAGGCVVFSDSTWRQPMPETCSADRASVVSAVAASVLAQHPGRILVGIDGRTAAGKTTFGHELAQVLAGQGLTVLRASLDDFKQPWRDRHRYDRESGEGYYRNAFDYASLTRLLLEPFSAGAPDGVVLCSIDPITQIDHSATRVPAPEAAVLVVDGVFAFRPEIDRWWDLRIWLDVDGHDSVARGVERDHARVGEESVSLHRDRYGVAEDLYLSEVDPVSRADLVIDNRDFAAPRLARG
jgi:uridine kinase